MKDIISKTIALGLGIGITGKQQIEKIASDIQKKTKMNKKDSKKFVNDMIDKGEKVRVRFDKEITKLVKDAVAVVTPVTKKEDHKKKPASKSGKKKSAKKVVKKAAKKTTKKAAKKSKKKAAKKSGKK